LFDVSFDLDLVRPLRLRPRVQSHRQTCGDQPPAETTEGANADAEGGNDLVVGVRSACGRVRHEEDAGMGQPAGRSLPGGRPRCSNAVRSSAVNVTRYLSIAPSVTQGKGSAFPSGYGSRTTYQSKLDGILALKQAKSACFRG